MLLVWHLLSKLNIEISLLTIEKSLWTIIKPKKIKEIKEMRIILKNRLKKCREKFIVLNSLEISQYLN